MQFVLKAEQLEYSKWFSVFELSTGYVSPHTSTSLKLAIIEVKLDSTGSDIST